MIWVIISGGRFAREDGIGANAYAIGAESSRGGSSGTDSRRRRERSPRTHRQSLPGDFSAAQLLSHFDMFHIVV